MSEEIKAQGNPFAWAWLMNGEIWDLTSRKDAYKPLHEKHIQIPLYTSPAIPEGWPECEEFYNLMQAYRHAPMNDQDAVVAAYEAVKDWLTKQGETA